jgi:cytochrome c
MRAVRALLAGVVLALCAGCGLEGRAPGREEAAHLAGGDPAEGRRLLRAYGCWTCHTIPGVTGADARVGPPLTGFAGRMYIAGLLANNPENLVRWIQDPTAVDSLTAMPDVGASSAEARHMAAYLYTLR